VARLLPNPSHSLSTPPALRSPPTRADGRQATEIAAPTFGEVPARRLHHERPNDFNGFRDRCGGARCCWCLWAPRFIHCGYYQCSSCKIALVWIAVQVTKHHVRFLTHHHPWRRAAGVCSFAGELATKIDGVRNPSDESDATWPRRIARFAPSHKRVAINLKTVGILGARLHGGRPSASCASRADLLRRGRRD
jgi:hypothetical protein